MYFGALVFFIAAPLALGSSWTLLLVPLSFRGPRRTSGSTKKDSFWPIIPATSPMAKKVRHHMIPSSGSPLMAPMDNLHIRTATPTDRSVLAHLHALLWPEFSSEEHDRELITLLHGSAQRVLPLVIFVAEEHDGALVGFLEAGLRSCADGCDESRPVGYVKGWFVEGHHRGQGIGAQLLRAAEDWARARRCREMASDTDIENTLSQRAHEASGFAVAARAILYRKFL